MRSITYGSTYTALAMSTTFSPNGVFWSRMTLIPGIRHWRPWTPQTALMLRAFFAVRLDLYFVSESIRNCRSMSLEHVCCFSSFESCRQCLPFQAVSLLMNCSPSNWLPLLDVMFKTVHRRYITCAQSCQERIERCQACPKTRRERKTWCQTLTDCDLNNIECNYCHKKGHYKSSCAALAAKQGDEAAPKQTNAQDNGEKTEHWTRTPPTESDSPIKSATVEGKSVTFKWCKSCRRWRSGPKKHLTEDHKKRGALEQ